MRDLISRQEAIDAVLRLDASHCVSWKDAVIDTIDVLPSAQKKGEWIFNPSNTIEMMFTKPKCSECGFESADGGNYCSNCGADMRGNNDGIN